MTSIKHAAYDNQGFTTQFVIGGLLRNPLLDSTIIVASKFKEPSQVKITMVFNDDIKRRTVVERKELTADIISDMLSDLLHDIAKS